jgi:hypothetical protein
MTAMSARQSRVGFVGFNEIKRNAPRVLKVLKLFDSRLAFCGCAIMISLHSTAMRL